MADLIPISGLVWQNWGVEIEKLPRDQWRAAINKIPEHYQRYIINALIRRYGLTVDAGGTSG